MVGGLFLEMLGNDSPHALQGSFQPDSQADHCLRLGLARPGPAGLPRALPQVINNDERQFNAPGVRVPDALALPGRARAMRPPGPTANTIPAWTPRPSSRQERLEASRQVVLGLIQAWERNQYVVNHFKGEIFCSGYGIWIDYRVNPEGHRRLFEIMERCDGERTVADIAGELGISFQAVWEVVALLRRERAGVASAARSSRHRPR